LDLDGQDLKCRTDMGDLIYGIHPKSNGCGDLQRNRWWRALPVRWRHWRLTGASVPSAPRHDGARFLSSKRCGGHGDPYPMQVAARVVVKALRDGGFFFPKLDSVARLVLSSSDDVDGTYGCGTTSSPSSSASIIPKGNERSCTNTARVWRVLTNCG
jgi:hypothetical protein